MATLEQLETALINAHEAGDEEAARILAAEILRVRGAHAEETPPPQEPMGRVEAMLSGAERGLKPFGEFAERLNPLGYIARAAEDVLRPGARAASEAAIENRLAAQARRAETERPGYSFAGRIAGEVLGTAPMLLLGGAGIAGAGGSLARAAPTVGRAVQQFGRAVQTGGVGVRAPTMANRAAIARGAPVAASRGGRMALRVGGGAASGFASGALTDQDLVTSTIGGGGIPIIGTIARRGAGATFDALAMRVGTVRAAEIMRNLIAENATAIMAALENAPRNARANTAQFLAEQGLLTPELAAATRIVSATGENAPLLEVAQRRAAGQQEMRNVLMGGPTRTEGISATNAMRQGVRSATDIMREENLGLADVGRTQMIPAERSAQMLDAIAAEINNSGVVRRMRGLEGRSREQLDIMFQNPELFTTGRVAQRTGEVADQAGQRADDAIAAQLGLRDLARARREAAENLRAQGLQPLDISGVVGRLRQQAAEAQFVNPARYRVMSEFADNLEARARAMGGVIDATGLYELRKNMADTVAQLLGPVDPSALQRRTAEVIGETTPLIDDAIEAAGGAGWRQYLRTFEAGMRNVERAEFARALEKLPPQRFEQVMSGNDPKFVSDFFGPGRYDINAELFGSQLPAAHRLSREIGADLDVAATGLRDIPQPLRGPLAAGTRRSVEGMLEPGFDVLGRGAFRVLGGLPGVHGGGITAERAEQAIANRMALSVVRRLAPALADPAAAFRLAQQRSTNAMLRGAIDRVGIPGLAAGTQTAQQIVAGQPVYEEPADTVVPALTVTYRPAEWDANGNYIGPVWERGGTWDENANYIPPRR